MRWEYRLDLTWRGDDQVFGLQAAIMIALLCSGDKWRPASVEGRGVMGEGGSGWGAVSAAIM